MDLGFDRPREPGPGRAGAEAGYTSSVTTTGE
jgi:hypothetical protein